MTVFLIMRSYTLYKWKYPMKAGNIVLMSYAGRNQSTTFSFEITASLISASVMGAKGWFSAV